MANYTHDQAINLSKEFIANAPTTNISTIAADMVHGKIWRYYPWRWTLGALTSIALVDGTQDYTIADSDFWRPQNDHSLFITRTDPTPDEYQPLRLVQGLVEELNIKRGWPNFELISRDQESGKLRLESAVQVPSGVTLQIDGRYQKVPTKITATSVSMTQPDYYMDVTVAGILYYFYKFADDTRAGSVVIDGRGNRQYTGQLGVFMYSLEEMAQNEDQGNGPPIIVPSEPLGTGGHFGTSEYRTVYG